MDELENSISKQSKEVQNEKGHMFSLICGRQIQTQIQIYTFMYVAHVCNSGTVPWDSEEERERKTLTESEQV
jgi:hydroxymethylpyrimidine pyrophosphatase-like HAD family hydrolase